MQINSLPNSKLRVISGLVIGICCILVSFAPSNIIVLFLAIILLLVSYEFSTFIIKPKSKQVSLFALSIVGGLIGYYNTLGYQMLLLVIFCLVGLVVLLYLPKLNSPDSQVLVTSILYPGLCLGILANYLDTIDNTMPLLLLFFTLIWSSDTGGYYFGKKFGRRKLLERVSPKKTVEGLIGGGLVTIFCSLIWHLIYAEYHLSTAILLGIVIWLSCSFGDLVQSHLKRRFDIKDSSNLIPGHGGFFDRFDGFIFAAPFFVITHYLAA